MRPRPFQSPCGAIRLLLLAFAAAAVLVSGSVARADDPGDLRAQAGALEDANAALAEDEHAVLLDLYALQASLGRAERHLSALEAQRAEAEREVEDARRRLALARRAEAEAQDRLAARVTALYVEGEADPFEILLGAASLDDVLTALDGLSRLAEEDERIAAQVESAQEDLQAALAGARGEQARLRSSVAEAGAAVATLARERDERGSYLESVRSRRKLNASEIRTLTAQAAEAEARSAEIQTAAHETPVGAVPAPVSAEPRSAVASIQAAGGDPPAGGRRLLTVDAVAYSLPGYTASGLPVGKGVVAVDPTVIPLGTRMYVPGYGRAVAADTGSAIKGNIIDLWFPTYEQAAAWGRQTVTITIYG